MSPAITYSSLGNTSSEGTIIENLSPPPICPMEFQQIVEVTKIRNEDGTITQQTVTRTVAPSHMPPMATTMHGQEGTFHSAVASDNRDADSLSPMSQNNGSVAAVNSKFEDSKGQDEEPNMWALS